MPIDFLWGEKNNIKVPEGKWCDCCKQFGALYVVRVTVNFHDNGPLVHGVAAGLCWSCYEDMTTGQDPSKRGKLRRSFEANMAFKAGQQFAEQVKAGDGIREAIANFCEEPDSMRMLRNMLHDLEEADG